VTKHLLFLWRRDGSDCNAYVEETVLCTINGIVGLEALGMANTFQQVKESGESVKVTLQADNDFYSQVQRVRQWRARHMW
jgi:hypothetical protein